MVNGSAYLEQRGILSVAAQYGLRYLEGRHAIQIPYYDALGTTSYSRLRLIDPNASVKYLSPGGTQRHLYNVVDSSKSPVFITEGEFDALTLLQLGYHAVGVPGARTFMPEWRWLFEEVDVIVFFDGDEDGRKYGADIARLLHRTANSVVSLHKQIPEGKDVNDLWVEGTLEAFLKEHL